MLGFSGGLSRSQAVAMATLAVFVMVFVAMMTVAQGASGADGALAAAKKRATRPAGSVKLPTKKMKVVSGTRCGLFGATWRSGIVIKGGYFVSDFHQAKNFTLAAKKAKSKKKKAAQLKQAKSFTTKASKGAKKCAYRAPLPAPAPAPAPAPTTSKGLTFRFKDAIGVAVKSAAGASSASAGRSSGRGPVASAAADSSNLVALQADGATVDAVDPATIPTSTAGGQFGSGVNVDKVLVGPNNKVYVLFKRPTNLAPVPAPGYYGPIAQELCTLAQVDRDTGTPTCVEKGYMSWGWSGNAYQSGAGIQFDREGAIYYRANVNVYPGGYEVVRKWKEGLPGEPPAVIDIAGNENQWVSAFLVTDDGTVLFQGSSGNGGSQYLRKRSPAGTVSTISGDSSTSFMSKFPDGKVYLGLNNWGGGVDGGIAIFDADTGALDPRRWIGARSDLSSANQPYNNLFASPWNCNSGNIDPTYSPLCDSGLQWNPEIRSIQTTQNRAVYALSGYSYGNQGTLLRLYPTLAAINLAVAKPSTFVLSGDDAVVVGNTSSATGSKPITAIRHLATNTDSVVFAADEMDVTSLVASPTGGKVFFTGLRFSDNARVGGYIDLATRRPVISTERAEKLESVSIFR